MTRIELSFRETLRWIVWLSIAICVAVGVLGLAGWVLHIQILKSILPGFIAIKPNTCIALLCLAISLHLHRDEAAASTATRRWAALTAALPAVVGFLSLLEGTLGWNLGIDQLLFSESMTEAIGSLRPGLMSPIAAADFMLIGSALLLINRVTRGGVWISEFLAYAAEAVAGFALLDIILEPRGFHGHIAIQTALALCILPLGVLSSRPGLGIAALLLHGIEKGWLTREPEPRAPRLVVSFGTPVVLSVLATMLATRYSQIYSVSHPFLFLYPAVTLAYIIGGFFACVLSICFLTIAALLFLLDPGAAGIRGLQDSLALSIFLVSSLGYCALLKLSDLKKQRAEFQMKDTLAYRRSLIEASPNLLFFVTRDGKISEVNQSVQSATGYLREQLIDRSFFECFTEPDRARGANVQTVTMGVARDHTLHFIDARGRALPVLYAASALRNSRGEVDGVLAILHDLTEHEQMMQKVRHLAAIVECSDDAIYSKSLDGRITSWNRAAEKLYGYTAEEMIGKNLSEIVPEEFSGEVEQFIQQLRNGERLSHHDTLRRRRDGQLVPVSISLSPIFDPSGRVQEIAAIVRDITDRKRNEAAIKQAALYARSLIEASVDPLVTIDRQGKITDVNAATEVATGLRREQLIGSDFSDYFTDPAKAREGYEKVFRDGIVRDYPLVLRHQSGEEMYVLYNARTFLDAEGHVKGAFAAARDVTARHRAEQELNALNAELEVRVASRTEALMAVNKELEAFNYAVAHDLRAPLRHIHGFAELLAEEASPVLDESGRKHLEFIQSSVRNMEHLLEDLLNLSRLSRQEMRKQVCGLGSLVNEVVSTLKRGHPDRTVEWRIAELPYVECDEALMRQVLVNLLANALKFTRDRQPAVIEVGSKEVDGDPVIFIRDNGVGFSMKYIDKLFGLFQRLHRQQDFEGTGVGLAIVQRIILRHGGQVWAEGELNKGATFYFRLAASNPESAEQHAELTEA